MCSFIAPCGAIRHVGAPLAHRGWASYSDVRGLKRAQRTQKSRTAPRSTICTKGGKLFYYTSTKDRCQCVLLLGLFCDLWAQFSPKLWERRASSISHIIPLQKSPHSFEQRRQQYELLTDVHSASPSPTSCAPKFQRFRLAMHHS